MIKDKNWTISSNDKINISIIQPNTVNKLSYDNNETILRMNQLYNLSLKTLSSNPYLVLWPESPIPVTYQDIKDNYYKKILNVFKDKPYLITGTFYEENNHIFNSLINITNPEIFYHKIHLVPFGEYLPFKYLNTFYTSIGLNIYGLSKGYNSNSFSVGNFLLQSH